MIVQMIEKDAWNQIEDPNLRWLFQLTDKIDILEREYGVVGRPGVPRPVMLRCFLLKAYFGIPSLRQLVQFLHHHLSWCQTIGLVYVPHLSAFSRAGAWWQEEGMRMLHNGLLRQLSLNTDVVFFDSTALRSSLYDKQARWGKSTRYDNYKGYKLHTVTNRSGMVLAYQVTTANVYDGDPVPSLFKQLRRYSIQFALGMPSMMRRKFSDKHKSVR